MTFVLCLLGGLVLGIVLSLGYVAERVRAYKPDFPPLSTAVVGILLGLLAVAVGGGLGWTIDPPHTPAPSLICETETR